MGHFTSAPGGKTGLLGKGTLTGELWFSHVLTSRWRFSRHLPPSTPLDIVGDPLFLHRLKFIVETGFVGGFHHVGSFHCVFHQGLGKGGGH